MNELRALLTDTTEAVLGRLPSDESAAWQAVRNVGLDKVMVPENEGGFGGGWVEAFIVLRASGFHAIPLPIAEEIVAPRQQNVGTSSQIRHMALARTCQMAGAMQAALVMSVRFVQERKQFGKPLSSFQAIQQQIALFAEEAAATDMAASSACHAADCGSAVFEIASAKLRANMAVSTATSVAHQVHGAMGFTSEYGLQSLTTRLWQWRSDFGNDRFWAEQIGAWVSARGSVGFWPTLVHPDMTD